MDKILICEANIALKRMLETLKNAEPYIIRVGKYAQDEAIIGQPNHGHGWYRKFEKQSKKRNLKG